MGGLSYVAKIQESFGNNHHNCIVALYFYRVHER